MTNLLILTHNGHVLMRLVLRRLCAGNPASNVVPSHASRSLGFWLSAFSFHRYHHVFLKWPPQPLLHLNLQEILPTVALAFLAMPPAAPLLQSPKASLCSLSHLQQQWQDYSLESSDESSLAVTLVNVPLTARAQYLETIEEGALQTEEGDSSDEKQFRGWSWGGLLWSIRQGSKRAQLMIQDSEIWSVTCMTFLMLGLCIGSMYLSV